METGIKNSLSSHNYSLWDRIMILRSLSLSDSDQPFLSNFQSQGRLSQFSEVRGKFDGAGGLPLTLEIAKIPLLSGERKTVNKAVDNYTDIKQRLCNIVVFSVYICRSEKINPGNVCTMPGVNILNDDDGQFCN